MVFQFIQMLPSSLVLRCRLKVTAEHVLLKYEQYEKVLTCSLEESTIVFYYFSSMVSVLLLILYLRRTQQALQLPIEARNSTVQSHQYPSPYQQHQEFSTILARCCLTLFFQQELVFPTTHSSLIFTCSNVSAILFKCLTYNHLRQ